MSRRALLSLPLCWMLAMPLAAAPQEPAAAGEGPRVAAFEQAYRPGKRGQKAAGVTERRAAIAQLDGLDSAKVASALAEAYRTVEDEVAALEAERKAILDELAQILAGQEGKEQRTLPLDKNQRFQELRERLGSLGEETQGLVDLRQALGERLARLRGREALRFLLQKLLPDKKAPVPLRLAAGRALGAGAAEMIDEVGAALGRARAGEELLPLLDALTLAGPAARPHAQLVIKLLAHEDAAVRERAALALAKIAVAEAIEPMIGLVATSSGQMQRRVAAALEVLTGQQFGVDVGAWRAWWAAEGASFAASGKPLGQGTPSHRKDTDRNYYFGIPQDQSDSILYVLDCSGSMKEEVDFALPGTTAGGKAAKQTRLEACKAELIRALGLLQPKQQFAILWYNDLPHWWQPKLQPAGKEQVGAAQQFVRTLQPASSTNIHDSMQLAFTLVGRGARDKYYGVAIDTIFLLTDGSPTKPDGQLDSTERVLAGVRGWNALKRVTIHTIGIGKGLNEVFLEQLARENGGEFKRF